MQAHCGQGCTAHAVCAGALLGCGIAALCDAVHLQSQRWRLEEPGASLLLCFCFAETVDFPYQFTHLGAILVATVRELTCFSSALHFPVLPMSCNRSSLTAIILRGFVSHLSACYQIVDQGAIRPLMFLCRFPDLEIQRYAALAIAALALGGHGNNKTRIIEEGAAKPLIELGVCCAIAFLFVCCVFNVPCVLTSIAARFPDVEIQRCASLALACIVVGPEMNTKMSIMADDGLLPLLALCACSDVECERAATFAIGCLAECPDVKGKIVELGGTVTMVQQGRSDDLEVRRNCGYFLALLAEEVRRVHVVWRGGACESAPCGRAVDAL